MYGMLTSDCLFPRSFVRHHYMIKEGIQRVSVTMDRSENVQGQSLLLVIVYSHILAPFLSTFVRSNCNDMKFGALALWDCQAVKEGLGDGWLGSLERLRCIPKDIWGIGAGRGFSGAVCTSHLCEAMANLAAVHFGSDEGSIWSDRNGLMNMFCLVASLLHILCKSRIK